MRIINEYRNNRVTVDFTSKDGTPNDKLADVCDGLYRADEKDSIANEAYDNAFEEAVGGGFGAWRLRADYEDHENDEDERQRILIEPIYDADSSVWFDLDAKRQDKADAKVCFVINSLTYDSYIEEYGDDPASWPKTVHQYEFDWLTPDVVYVAEYYRVEEVGETVRIFENLAGTEERYTTHDFREDESLEEMLAAVGTVEVRQKRVKKKMVHKYIMSGSKILEDCGYVAGKCIPIIPVFGKRWFVDNIERCMGHVRLAKDAQRLKNMQISKLAEISALSTVEKPIMTPEQVAGHQVMWSEDNLKDYPYMLVNPITDANGNQAVSGPVGYTKPPQIPPAMAALLQITETDMMQILGNQTGGEEIASNISGKAVELIQTRLDMQTFIYMSNFSKAMRRCGEVWLSMAKDVYVEDERKMKIIEVTEEINSVTLMQPAISEMGEVVMENDLSKATFDVDVEVGPSSSTKKQATVRALTGMMQITADPEMQSVLGAMAMMNMEGEGISDVRKYFRQKLLKMGVIQPTEAEAEEMMTAMQNQPPDPNAVFLEAAAEEATAKAAKARADVVKTIADAELQQARVLETGASTDLEQARTLETLAGIEQENMRVETESEERSVKSARLLQDMIRDS
tara:strand:- start:22 stop:1905 length:1884 start_codon:yes stop_codon:yes gene_type:complete